MRSVEIEFFDAPQPLHPIVLRPDKEYDVTRITVRSTGHASTANSDPVTFSVHVRAQDDDRQTPEEREAADRAYEEYMGEDM